MKRVLAGVALVFALSSPAFAGGSQFCIPFIGCIGGPGPGPGGGWGTHDAPAPLIGVGLPGLAIGVGYGAYLLARRRRKA